MFTSPRIMAALLLAAGVFAASAFASKAEASELVTVAIDHARVLKIGRPAETVIVGNPAIVDVTVHDSETLVLTGRSYGITNLVVLDREGEPILDESVAVKNFEDNTVRVYRQAERITYACAPQCEPTVTIGDDPDEFRNAAAQFTARQTMATSVLK